MPLFWWIIRVQWILQRGNCFFNCEFLTIYLCISRLFLTICGQKCLFCFSKSNFKSLIVYQFSASHIVGQKSVHFHVISEHFIKKHVYFCFGKSNSNEQIWLKSTFPLNSHFLCFWHQWFSFATNLKLSLENKNSKICSKKSNERRKRLGTAGVKEFSLKQYHKSENWLIRSDKLHHK